VSVYHRATWQLTSMIHGSVIVVFNLVPQFKFLVQFSTQFFKIIQFRHLSFETKLVNKLNYNLYKHVKIIVLNLYIKSLHINIQIILFFTSVKNFMYKKLQMLK